MARSWLRNLGMSNPDSGGDLRVSKTYFQKPHASADVRQQDNVDRELYGSYSTNAVAQVVLQVGEKKGNLGKVTLELVLVVYHAEVCRAVS